MENNLSGFSYLMGRVQFNMDRGGFEDVVFRLGPTSVYHKPLAEFLIERGYLVVFVTNETIKKNRSLLDGRWDKNDTKDSANAADLVCQGKCQYYDLPDIKLRDLRNLLLFRKRLRKQLHSSKMRIRNNLVAQYFPELDKLWKTREEENLAIVRWSLAPAKIAAMKFLMLCVPPQRHQGTKITERIIGSMPTIDIIIKMHIISSCLNALAADLLTLM